MQIHVANCRCQSNIASRDSAAVGVVDGLEVLAHAPQPRDVARTGLT
jgi:hypothetical protein